MGDKMGFPISKILNYTRRQENKINKEIAAGTASAWFDKSALRTAIKKHLAAEQELTCCYCQKPQISDHGRLWDLEHILPESVFAAFFFNVRNHALACHECNTKKAAKIVIKDEFIDDAKSGAFFPYHSDAYTIPHPHLEDPTLYLKVTRGHRFENFQPLQPEGIPCNGRPKGEVLIEVCELGDRSIGSAKVREFAVAPEITLIIDAYHYAIKRGDHNESATQYENLLRHIANTNK
jgi:hypothetical protein